MKDVQQQGGPFEQQSEYVGLDRQLTVDTTNRRVLLHDGVTPGGHIIAPRNELDQRYMGIIPDLEGFAEFTPSQKGFPARLAAGAYALRAIVGTIGQIEVVNPYGINGDVTIQLDDMITKDLVFAGTVQFDTVISGVGFIGDTQGDHTGNVQGNVTGNVTGDLTGDSTGTHTGPSVGAIDTRGATVDMDANSIPMSAVTGLNEAIAAIPSGVPTGFIGDWYGIADDVPDGWFLCDGNNGTPDLRDKFVMCAGPENAPHSTGGSNLFTPAGLVDASGTHTHTGTVDGHALTTAEMPSHKHANGVVDNVTTLFNHGTVGANPAPGGSMESNGDNAVYEGYTTSVGGGAAHSHGLTLNPAGSHTHGFTGTQADNRPAFYALYKIMKG